MKKEVAWVDKNQVDGLIRLLKQSLKKENERVIFVGFAYELFINLLLNNISIKTECHKNEIFQLFISAIKECYLKDELKNQNNLLSCFVRYVKNNYKKEGDYYRVVTQVSLANDFNNDFAKFYLSGFSVCIYKELPKILLRSRQSALKHTDLDGDSDEVVYIVISGKANSPEDCRQKTMKVINAIRGLWRFRIKENLDIFKMLDKYDNIAETKYYTGQIQTIHNKSGAVIADGLRWDEFYYFRKPTLHRDVTSMQEIFNRDKNRLIKLPYSEEMLRYYGLYAQALDVLDKENKFIKLWQLSEIILDTDDSDKLITMLSFNYKNRSDEKIMLKSLRNVRNRLVHGDYSPVNIDLSCFHLHKYINNLFRFALFNPFKAHSFKEIRTILMSTTEEACIDEKLSVLTQEKLRLRKVKKYISDVE